MAVEMESNPFWDYSVALYGRPGVSRACLELQESLGADVNLVLFCFWWAASGRAELEPAAFDSVVEQASRWHDDVVRPFRQARRAAKQGAPQLTATEAQAVYREVLRTELLLERAEQALIARAADAMVAAGITKPQGPDSAARGLERYFARIGASPGPGDDAAVAVISAAAFSLPLTGRKR